MEGISSSDLNNFLSKISKTIKNLSKEIKSSDETTLKSLNSQIQGIKDDFLEITTSIPEYLQKQFNEQINTTYKQLITTMNDINTKLNPIQQPQFLHQLIETRNQIPEQINQGILLIQDILTSDIPTETKFKNIQLAMEAVSKYLQQNQNSIISPTDKRTTRAWQNQSSVIWSSLLRWDRFIKQITEKLNFDPTPYLSPTDLLQTTQSLTEMPTPMTHSIRNPNALVKSKFQLSNKNISINNMDEEQSLTPILYDSISPALASTIRSNVGNLGINMYDLSNTHIKFEEGSAQLPNIKNENKTVRFQDNGHFMTNVNHENWDDISKHSRNTSISKGTLEMPIGSKRKLENVDMFKNKLDNSAPFWQANGLENIGFLPPPAIVENGAFNKPLSTNPQKFVFMTYESGINKFYNCKLPMKVNIPSGDFGIYHVVVNEVLFRTDIELLNEKDYIIIDPNNTVQVSILNEENEPQKTYNVALPKIELKIQNITEGLASLSIDYLNLDLLIGILQKTLEGIMINLSQPGESATLQVPVTDFLTITKNSLSGLGLRFILKSPDIIIEKDGIRYGIEIPTLNIFKIESCSSNFRHIFPPLQTTTSLSSQHKLALIDEQGDFIAHNSIEILRCNFAGPQMFLLNSSAQTVCPISNEYAKQFNTCALSYNTNEETNSLIQMTSNVELTMKNTNDFKVWLTDNYGQAVKLKSPMYVQVTVQPFINESVSSKSE